MPQQSIISFFDLNFTKRFRDTENRNIKFPKYSFTHINKD